MQRLVLKVRFFRQSAGHEPVRDCLAYLDTTDKKAIGADIKTVRSVGRSECRWFGN